MSLHRKYYKAGATIITQFFNSFYLITIIIKK